MTGIYKITNMSNGKVYVGQSKDIEVRWQQHKDELEKGKHCNKSMQYDYKRNPSAFVFEVLEECHLSLLNMREKYWIDQYKSTDKRKGYNLTKGGGPKRKGPRFSLLDELTK